MSATTFKTLVERPLAADETPVATKVKYFIGDYGIGLIFVLVMAYLGLTAPNFLTVDNLTNVVRQASVVGFVALGMTFVMITAGIDLSVGSIVGLTGIVVAIVAPASGSAFLVPVVLALVVGALVGCISAGMIVRGGIMPFLATLAMMAVARSAALVVTEGEVKSGLSEPVQWIGTGFLGPMPVPVALFFATAILADFVLSRTRFGYHVYAVGGSEESAQKVGISSRRILMAVYLVSGLFSAIAGIVLTARLNGAAPLAGTGYELQAIAAVVIGGTSLFGGVEKIRGTVVGVLLLGVVMNGLNLLNVSSYYQQGVQGLILVLAVLLNRWKTP